MTANVDLRPASIEDADLLLAWRNEPATRAASRSLHAVPETEHASWLTELLEDPHRHLWVAELAGDPVGQVRFDRVADGAYEISVSVAANHRSKSDPGQAEALGAVARPVARPA